MLNLKNLSGTSRTEWIGNGYSERHCYSALDKFYANEALVHKGERFEWLAPGQKPTARDIVWTPRAYIVSMSIDAPAFPKVRSRANLGFQESCVLAIYMLGSVSGRPLPQEDRGAKYHSSDQTSFLDVYVEARRLLGACVSTNEELGWASAGELSKS